MRFASDKSAGAGSVPGAPSGGTMLASLPFVPSRDGFSFENYGFIAGPQLSPHVMREMFGDVVCADQPSDSCTLTPAAQQWTYQEEDAYLGGHCQGFSVTALRFFTHNLSPPQFGGSTPFSLSLTPELESEIAYGAVTQDLAAVRRATLIDTPMQAVRFLEKALKTPSREVYVLGFGNGKLPPNQEGHAVVPIGIESVGGGKYYILIYDNNAPGETRAMTVDANNDSWVYDTATNPNKAISTWSGQGFANPMQLQPLSPALGVQPCPFCGPGTSNATGSRTIQITLGGNPDAHGHLLITTPGGRKVGYVNGRFVNQIKGARVHVPLLNDITAAHPEPTYEVPYVAGLRVTLSGRGASGRDTATVHIVGPGFGATVSNLLPSSATTDQITVAGGGKALSLHTLGSTPSQAPTLQLGLNQGRGGQVLAATPSKLASGGHLTVALAPGAKRLSVSGSGAAPVSLALTQVGPSGSHTTQKTNLSLPSNQAQTFSLGLFRVG